VRPTVVIAQSPVRDLARVYASHPDHLATGEATMAAVYPDARNPFAHLELIEEGLPAWTVPEMWITGASPTAVPIDVTDQVDRKIRALMCHETQHVDPAGTGTRVRAWMQLTATTLGLAEGRSAEAFQVVDTR
jgi:LmbE family N-acetylglucosaminyl deacetylase